MKKKLTKVLFIILISVISLGSNCFNDNKDEKGPKTYKIEGKITITNLCTSNIADIPAKIFIEKDLTFNNANTENFRKNNIPTNPVAGAINQKDANYEFSSTTNNIADKWKKKRITTTTFGSICGSITCPDTTKTCVDGATNVTQISATDNDNTPTHINKDYAVTCSCR